MDLITQAKEEAIVENLQNKIFSKNKAGIDSFTTVSTYLCAMFSPLNPNVKLKWVKLP